MNAVKTTIIEVLVLGGFAVGIGFTANTVRAKNSIAFGRNYFDKGPGAPEPTVKNDDRAIPPASPKGPGAASQVGVAENEEKHLDHSYQEIKFDQVQAIFEGTDPSTGAALFVDARNDQLYGEGHIPGAVQCDHYRLNDYIDGVLPLAEQVEKIIVYCNGGDCEDSIFMCGDLVEAGISFEKIYLYPGGWKQWVKQGMPVVKGRAPGSVDSAVQGASTGDEE